MKFQNMYRLFQSDFEQNYEKQKNKQGEKSYKTSTSIAIINYWV